MNSPHWLLIHKLVSMSLDDELSEAGSRQLSELLCKDPQARCTYVVYLQETAELRWLSSGLSTGEREPRRQAGVIRDLRNQAATLPFSSLRENWLVAGACVTCIVALCMLMVGYFLSNKRDKPDFAGPTHPLQVPDKVVGEPEATPPSSMPVATLTRLTNVIWTQGQPAPNELSRLRVGDTIAFDSGELEIVFDRGVEFLARGKCRFRIESPLHLVGGLGTFSAKVGESGRGFRIDTPTSSIVDRGTEFGVSIDAQGQTDVVCFQGVVELSYGPATSLSRSGVRDRLYQGEGLHIGGGGIPIRLVCTTASELPSIGSLRRNPATFSPVISDILDSLSDTASRKSYRIVHGGFADDVLAFIDRPHQWNGLDKSGVPEILSGCDYVMPFNDDKFSEEIQVEVDIARPAILYVLFSDGLDPPKWLLDQFEDTNVDIGLDEGRHKRSPTSSIGIGPGVSIDTIFSVWKREVAKPSTIVLGGIKRPENVQGYNMYGIAAKPLVR